MTTAIAIKENDLTKAIADGLVIDEYPVERSGKYLVVKTISVIQSRGLWYGISRESGGFESHTNYFGRDEQFCSNLELKDCGFPTAEDAAIAVACRYGVTGIKKIVKGDQWRGFYTHCCAVFGAE